MKTIWTAPGYGSTLAELLAGAHKAYPKLCGAPRPGDEGKITNLYIMDDGKWEPYDIERIRNINIFREEGLMP